MSEGYLRQDPESGRLAIGFSVLMLSASLLDSNRMRLEAIPHLQSLSKLTGERNNLGIIHQNKVLYLAGVEKPSLPTIYKPFRKNRAGTLLLAWQGHSRARPGAEVQALLAAEPLYAQTANSITSMPRFIEDLEATGGAAMRSIARSTCQILAAWRNDLRRAKPRGRSDRGQWTRRRTVARSHRCSAPDGRAHLSQALGWRHVERHADDGEGGSSVVR